MSHLNFKNIFFANKWCFTAAIIDFCIKLIHNYYLNKAESFSIVVLRLLIVIFTIIDVSITLDNYFYHKTFCLGLRHSTTLKKFDERRRIKVIELVFKSYVWILLLWCVPNAKAYIRQESLLSRKFWGYTRKLTFVLLFFSAYIQWSRSQISLCSSRTSNHIFLFNFFCVKNIDKNILK